MNCSKEFFLACLGGGLSDYPHNTLLAYDLALYHKYDSRPFGEIVHEGGQTILRVGNDIDSDGIKVIV